MKISHFMLKSKKGNSPGQNLWILAVFLSFLPMIIQGQSKISLTASVDKSTMTIGDLITYTVIVTCDQDLEVKLPSLGENLGGFEIRDYHVHKPHKQEGQIIDRFDYTISTFDVGEFEIPPVEIRYIIPPDTKEKVLKTDSIRIVVESVKPSEEGDIREIKSPWEIPYNWKPLLLIGAIALLAVLGIIGLIIFIRRRRRGEALLPRKLEPLRPPHEVAYEELKRLEESDLLEKGKIKKFYTKISEIIRRYVEGRFQIPAMEQTTTDLLDNLKSVLSTDNHLDLFEQFLGLCDLVKFAKYIPETQENKTVMQQAIQIVDETKQVEETTEMEDTQKTEGAKAE